MRAVIIFLLVISSSLGFAHDHLYGQISVAPADARYEIVQSKIDNGLIFRIDKYSGRVDYLAEGAERLSWRLIEAEKNKRDRGKDSAVSYQLSLSGTDSRMVFLLNTDTGATWQLALNPQSGFYWKTLD